jgi:glutamate-5-semialdehyde dehydrogenase
VTQVLLPEFDVPGAAQAARAASRTLATAPTSTKNAALLALAELLTASTDRIVRENARDLEVAEQSGLSAALVDRLRLDAPRIQGMASGVREVVQLPDPVGRIEGIERRPSGIEVGRMRIPLGVIAIIYESRPNVTVDAAALTLKSGNVVLLRGGSEALHSNRVLTALCQEAIRSAGLPAACVGFIDTTDRAAVATLLRQDRHIDLVIPRGGEGLIRYVTETSTIPVIQHYKGVCHLFVDRDADLDQAALIVHNAKVQRPGVCNALETLLVDRAIAAEALPRLLEPLARAGVELRGDDAVCTLWPGAVPATDADWDEEYLDLVLAVRVIDDMDAAIAHIDAHGSGHTDGILTKSYERSREFVRRVGSSCVVVNASTRFNDGGQLGLGAEIGISTSKLHAYGPMGLEELTTRKFIVLGEGQIRT